MILRAWAFVLPLLAFTASAPAQLTERHKHEVLTEMERVLTERAFVPGIDLGRWPLFLDRRRDQIERAETPDAFVRVVNSSLREFGISHISIRRDSAPAGRSFELQAPLQEPRARGGDTLRWIDDRTAMIRINGFSASYQPAHVERLFREAADAEALVLDLRGNPGGRVENMSHLLGMLLPNNTPVGTFIGRRAADAYATAGRGEPSDPRLIAEWYSRKYRVQTGRVRPFRGEVVVLIDRGSASAAEIVASALRENRRSPLVGTRTAGAVLMSTFHRLPHGFQLQFPISDYVSIRGDRLEGSPLRPDVELSPAEVRTAAAVDAALATLSQVRR
jgi:C-terminal processing protease CtpA/Prc